MTNKFAPLLVAFENATPEEFHASLVRAGIYNADGTLSDEYQEKPRRKRAKKAE